MARASQIPRICSSHNPVDLLPSQMQSTSNSNIRSTSIARCITQQIHRSPCDILLSPDPLRWRRTIHNILRQTGITIPRNLRLLGIDKTRRDGVYADPLWRKLDRKCFGHHMYAAL